MDYLTFKVECLLEQIGDGYPVPDRSSIMPTSMREGGKAFKQEGVALASRIRREDVPTTLKQVYNLLEKSGIIDMDSVVPLGSTMHLNKPTMGDIDILVKSAKPFQNVADFKNTLYDLIYVEGYPIRDLAEKGRDYLFDMFTFLFPIVNENNELTNEKVQVDIILAENDKTYNWRYSWYSTPMESAWKGAARNVLMGVIAKHKGFTWEKDGLYKSEVVHSGWDYEKNEKITDDPKEAVQEVYGVDDVRVIESVESILQWLDTQPMKEEVMQDFNNIVSRNEADGREMRNRGDQK